MRDLVEMTLADSARAKSPAEGVAFIERYILPTRARCEQLEAEGKIVAGGPASAAVRLVLVLVVDAASPLELDEIVEGLAAWPLMETRVTPMTTFRDRAKSLEPRLAALREAVANGG